MTGGRIERIGGFVKATERAYVGFLNKMRYDLFVQGMSVLESQGKTIENAPEDYKALASLINNSTGRGKLFNNGKVNLEKTAAILNSAIYSPRFLASRLNLLGLSDIATLGNGYYGNMPKEIRVKAITEMVNAICLLYTSPSPRDRTRSRMPSSA